MNLSSKVAILRSLKSISKCTGSTKQIHQPLGPAQAHEDHPRSGLGLSGVEDQLLHHLWLAFDEN